MSRTYVTKEGRVCGPMPVSAGAMTVLADVALAAFLRTCYFSSQAPRKVERLRRSGYVSVSEHGYVYATEAGKALLRDSQP